MEVRLFWQAIQIWERRLEPGTALALALAGNFREGLGFELGRELTRLEVCRNQRRLGLLEEAARTLEACQQGVAQALNRVQREQALWQRGAGDKAGFDWMAGDPSRLEWRLNQEKLRLRVAQGRQHTPEEFRDCAEFMRLASEAQHRCEQVQSWQPLDDLSWDTFYFASYVAFEGWEEQCLKLLAGSADHYRRVKHRPALALALCFQGQLLKSLKRLPEALQVWKEATLNLESYLYELPAGGLSDLEFHTVYRGCYQDLADLQSLLQQPDAALATLARLQNLEALERGPLPSTSGASPGLDPASLQPLLDGETAVVQFLPGEDSLLTFLVTRDGMKSWRVPLSGKQLDGLVRKARQRLSQPESPPEGELAELYQHLISPLEPQLAGKKRLVFVPSGYLFYLPFAALGHKVDQSWRYLIQDYSCSVVSKLSDVQRLRQPPRPFQGTVLALGNPDGTLPAAAEECLEIARMFPGSTSLVGREVSVRDFRNLSGSSYLHLATHASLDSSRPWNSYLVLGNHTRLNMAEVYLLPLESTRLVTLSACQTALGEHLPGQEIASLAETFAAAGANSVLATLWRIPDESTRDLMVSMYRQLREGRSLGEALREAQLEALARPATAHPFYWAPFSLLGDWR